MSVLGSFGIEQAITSGNLIVEPKPTPGPGEVDSPYDSCSVQLHLDSTLWVPRDNLKLSFDLSGPGDIRETIDTVCDRVQIPEAGYTLERGRFVLAQTVERVGFPSEEAGLAGRIEGRSSFARTGLLVHFTAPTLHAGWVGNITLELLNLGPLDLILRPNLALCQLIVETVDGGYARSANQQFDGQTEASGKSNGRTIEPALHKD